MTAWLLHVGLLVGACLGLSCASERAPSALKPVLMDASLEVAVQAAPTMLEGSPAYRQEYGSQAIYRAVVEDHVRTVEDWDKWWASRGA